LHGGVVHRGTHSGSERERHAGEDNYCGDKWVTRVARGDGHDGWGTSVCRWVARRGVTYAMSVTLLTSH